jgi:hypothetical protein
MERYSFWRDVAERTWRNVLQVLAPVIAVMAASGQPVDPAQLALSAGTVALYTVLKALAGVTAGADTSVGAQLLDRAGSAVAATLLAFLPEAAMTSIASWAAVDWAAVGWAALASAVLAIVTYVTDPPTFARAGWEEA